MVVNILFSKWIIYHKRNILFHVISPTLENTKNRLGILTPCDESEQSPLPRDTHRSYLQGRLLGFRAWNAMSGIFQARRSRFSTSHSLFPLERSRDPEQHYWGQKGQKAVTLLQRGKNWKGILDHICPISKKQSMFLLIPSYACTPSL